MTEQLGQEQIACIATKRHSWSQAPTEGSATLVQKHLCVPFQCSFSTQLSKAASASCGAPACSCAPDTLKHVPAHKHARYVCDQPFCRVRSLTTIPDWVHSSMPG